MARCDHGYRDCGGIIFSYGSARHRGRRFARIDHRGSDSRRRARAGLSAVHAGRTLLYFAPIRLDSVSRKFVLGDLRRSCGWRRLSDRVASNEIATRRGGRGVASRHESDLLGMVAHGRSFPAQQFSRRAADLVVGDVARTA